MDTTKMEAEGTILLNGRSYDTGLLKSMSAYVMQDDLLHAELTVAETIKYAADLRLSKSMDARQREQRQRDVISLLQIEHVKDVIIGDTQRKGISGGERKRVCVAIELLTAPKLIFLDEPTSGLDSTTALTVISTLKNLAEEGICTIVCTIHQPQKAIFNLFDNLILMKKGSIVYQGACQKALDFARHFGKECPPEMNPADFLIDAISANTKEVELGAAFDNNAVKEVPIDLSLGLSKGAFYEAELSIESWIAQFLVLTKRGWLQYARRTDIIFMNFVLVVLISIFVSCGIWYQIGTGQASIVTRGPSLFFAAVCQGIVASLQTISRFPSERAIILRERAAGSYHVSAYFAARTVVDFVATLWGTTLFCAIVYPTIGYQPGAKKFFIYWIYMVLDTNAALSLATMISCLCVTIELSTVVLSLILEISRLFGGFFTSPLQLLDYPNWTFADALSYLKYVFVGVAINEMTGLEYTCTDKEIAANTCVKTGEQTMKSKGYDLYTVDFCAGILVVYIVGCRIVAYLALRYIKR
jgi:ATP-binding cassette subfamily G (WHITE) protein 2